MISEQDLLKYNKIVFDLYSQGKTMEDIVVLIKNAGFSEEDVQKILNYVPQKSIQPNVSEQQVAPQTSKGYNFFLIFTVFFYFKYLFDTKKILTNKNINMQTPLLVLPMFFVSSFLIVYTILNGFIATAFLFLKLPMILTFLICFILFFWFKLTFSDALFNLFDKQTDFMVLYLWNFIPIANLFLFKKVLEKVYS